MMMKIPTMSFGVMPPCCSLVGGYQCFKEIYFLLLHSRQLWHKSLWSVWNKLPTYTWS